jgi:hypothetical protein
VFSILNEAGDVLYSAIVPDTSHQYMQSALADIFQTPGRSVSTIVVYTDNQLADAHMVRDTHTQYHPNVAQLETTFRYLLKERQFPIVAQDHQHAVQRVVRELARSHQDYRAAVKDIKAIFRTNQPIDYAAYREALQGWLSLYHKPQRLKYSSELMQTLELILNRSSAVGTGIADSDRVRNAITNLLDEQIASSILLAQSLSNAFGVAPIDQQRVVRESRHLALRALADAQAEARKAAVAVADEAVAAANKSVDDARAKAEELSRVRDAHPTRSTKAAATRAATALNNATAALEAAVDKLDSLTCEPVVDESSASDDNDDCDFEAVADNGESDEDEASCEEQALPEREITTGTSVTESWHNYLCKRLNTIAGCSTFETASTTLELLVDHYNRRCVCVCATYHTPFIHSFRVCVHAVPRTSPHRIDGFPLNAPPLRITQPPNGLSLQQLKELGFVPTHSDTTHWSPQIVAEFHTMLSRMHEKGDRWYTDYTEVAPLRNLSYYIAHHIFNDRITQQEVATIGNRIALAWQAANSASTR